MKRIFLFILALMSCMPVALRAQEPTDVGNPKAVELPGADVIGNRELPIGLDIVPWRPAATGEIKEGPTQLLDAPLRPIDPDEFRRELSIYQSSKP